MFENVISEFGKARGVGKLILFGSFRKGSETFGSDIDIAIVSDDKRLVSSSKEIADRILFDYGRVVSLLKFGTDEFSKSKEPIIKEIKKGRVLYERGN